MVMLSLMVQIAQADVVKPALVEINTQADNQVMVEIRASLEALLTGINARFTNTQDAPQAAEYDALRNLSAAELGEQFDVFVPALLTAIQLTADDQPIDLQLINTQIPAPGYTQVPRISRIMLRGQIPAASQSLRWYYPAAFGDNAVRVRQVDAQADLWLWSDWQWIQDDRPSQPFGLHAKPTALSSWQHLVDYVPIGFRHIVPMGADHLLFILGLYLFGGGWRALFWQVSVFTVAHSVTLGLGLAGWVSLPSRWVEPLIAASIVCIALENIGWRLISRRSAILTARTQVLSIRRLSIIFGFGLLHGLGFAEMLSAFGLPSGAFLAALLGFNLGVEAGQLVVIAAAFALTGWIRHPVYFRHWVVVPGSVCIALVGAAWTIERLW